MKRITKLSGNIYIIDKVTISENSEYYYGEAIDKLAKYEILHEELRNKQLKIIKEMDDLKKQGKNKTVHFKQLLTEKITNNNILSIFEVYGL